MGTVVLTLFILSLVANTTILSSKFVLHEVNNSIVEDDITNQVNNGLAKYGISTSILTKKTTNQLVKQAVKQVYAGEKINLDLSPVTKHVENNFSSQLSQFGLANAANEVSSSITTELNSAVNEQLNTPEVASFTKNLQLAKTITNLVMVISAGGCILLLVIALLRRSFLHDFSWIGLWSLIFGEGTIYGVGQLALQMVADQPDYVSFVAQVVTDFQRQANSILSILLLFVIVLFIGRIGKRVWRH